MEVVLAIGDAFLSSAFDVLIDRLAPQGDLLKMFRTRKNDVELLKKLKLTLLGLQAVLSDAEKKQASNQFVREWLNELRVAVDSAENLIEQVNYEALKLKVEGKHQNLAEKILKHCRFCNLCLSDDSFLNVNDKLEKTIETLQNLQNQISDLGLQNYFGLTKQETRTPSTCLVDESDIFGRHKEIKDLIDLLLSEDASGGNLTVVPIVGMGGAGKTTLAKVVYNDEKVKDHFGLKAWYCVSEPYDAFRITKGLLQEIGSFDSKNDGNFNQLQVKLKEGLKGKKFLVVLDDVWNDDYNEWDNLRNVFVQGDVGSKIIVTTRKESVAKMMCADRCAITVGTLSKDDSWALFKRHALENREHSELEEVGKKIADKCKGLPLALKALAGVLRGKSEVDEWRNILRSEIWDQQSCWNGTLPALMLSYNDLPPHLKRCFAFCAIYPKDYEFCKDQAIYLWIANGLVKQFCLGNEYFDELRSRSLFERVPESEWESERFLMHDLINDLAKIASSKLCIRLEENEGSDDMLEQSRHMSYSLGYDGEFEKLKLLSKSEQLRTLLPTNIGYSSQLSKRVLHNILPRLTSLRALSLSGYPTIELPNDLFIKLKLLRFLDLSETHIKKLPDSICVLYNLETLLLSSCQFLEELPLQMEKLINLRHLDITNTCCLKMPLHLSKLKSLQMLVGAKFLVGGSGGLRMEDLGEVHNLYGSLSVLELQNVVDRREAVKANMKEKEHVEKLSLKWSEGSSANDSQTERSILDGLRPYTNIKAVEITGYRGTRFSNWLADPSFLQLVDLSLSDCKDCDSLPALGQLPSLKFLSIRGMHGITEVTDEFYGSSSSKKPFNCLEKLEFEDMPEWKQWHVLGSGEFPILEYLSIEKCPKLMGKLPENLCCLTELRILKTTLFDEAQMFRSQFEGMMQIEELYIDNCDSVTSLPFSILPSSLKRITISGCQKLKLEEPVGYCNMFLEKLTLFKCDCIDDRSPELLPRARILSVERCNNLTSFLIPTATESLTIWGCENLEILSVAVGTHESAMTSLRIWNCEKLKCLPEIELFNLQVLEIYYCKKLVNGRKEWCLQRLPCLTELEIRHDGSDEGIQHWELPSSIKRLTMKNLKTLSSQVLKSLTSLEYLSIEDSLPQIQSLQEQGQLPSSLSVLNLCHHDELHSLHLCHLTSLRRLHIWNCPNLQSLSESTLPSSLSQLTIENCDNLQSLSESALPSSLSQLTIDDCDNLQSLSKSTLPSSLSNREVVIQLILT
ncbi:putative disease resistance RPP13-like protein 1 isoform X2 [Solanum tuberosum]|uniref:putative disease resistance RPP13-like protein 1 isoform X2 n=1 Tax=Solanum tuberosum TaxID=4113 RepID=UPI0003D257A7|nr:PREDICTED: putative disease resistance RPP13-like protein 1 isoform X2 [Solanum tuberosum]XP_006340235.1 PREDICTED: putative disease resistance RPP13-like protein 1 isoform X2 [Solanum tuberosum]